MENKKKIIVLIDRYMPILGGAQNNVHELSRRLSAAGYKMTVLTRRIYPDLPRHEFVDTVEVRRLGYFPVRVISKLLCFFRITWYLLWHKNQYDIVLSVPCIEITDLLPAYVSSFITKKPYVIRLTGFPQFDMPTTDELSSVWTKLLRPLLPQSVWLRAFRGASTFVAQSRVLHSIADKYGMRNCIIIPNGVDFQRFNPATSDERLALRQQLDLPKDKVVLISTGRYDKEKNQITFVKTAEKIEKELRTGQVFVLILGATQRNQLTSNEAELKEYVRENGLDRFVRFVDNAPNVEDFLRAADVFVHPTTNEGMSNALLEAMASGLPIVCSDIAQNTCIFPEEKGFFFSPLDTGVLTEKLVELVDSQELRVSFGKKLYQYAFDNFSNDHLARKYADLFDNVYFLHILKSYKDN